MGKLNWYFSARRPGGGRARNPQVEKFFRSDVVEDRTNAVIREGIQNSLDAGLSGGDIGQKSVRVQIKIGEVDYGSVSQYMTNFFDHLAAIEPPPPERPVASGQVRYLTFEDFNTTGLRGDPMEWDPADNKNAFFNFFRGEGVTNKSGSQRGRHGVGKLVFSLASDARLIFGLTRTDENQSNLMGTSTLMLHKLNGKSYDPDGWFGEERKVSGDTLVCPIQDAQYIEQFSKVFDLERSDLPGLSIVVPWLDKSVTAEAAVLAVAKGFFWAILTKQLYVDIVSGTSKFEITANTLRSILESISSPSSGEIDRMLQCVDLATWAIKQNKSNEIKVGLFDGNAPDWQSKMLSEDERTSIRVALGSGEPVSFKVPTRVRRKGQAVSAAELDSFQIYLQNDASCEDGMIQFVREGLLIPGVRYRRCPGYRGIVVIEEGPLATLLGDAENPSHTEWQEQNLKDSYMYTRESIRYVVQSVPSLLKIIQEGQKTADSTLLLDIFNLPQSSGIKKPQGPDESDEGAKKKPKQKKDTTKKPKLRRYQVEKTSDGFIVRRGSEQAELPQNMEIWVAYANRRSNPFSAYSKLDFELGCKPIVLKVTDATEVDRQENVLRLIDLKPSFEVEASGFDTNRDLCVDVKINVARVEQTDAESI